MTKCSWLTLSRVMIAIVAIAMWSCMDNNVSGPEDDSSAAKVPYGTTERGISPDVYVGNFDSSDDDQVCFDMSDLGYIGEVTSDMRGFKIDPPVNYDDGNISTTISADGKSLGWTTVAGTQVLAFIIKGGNNYNVYDYVGNVGNPAFDWMKSEFDNKLISPLQSTGRGKTNTPQISHYNVCYIPPMGDAEGCTPGYWRNHTDRWEGYTTGDIFDEVFGVTYLGATATLCGALQPNVYGAFAFHAVAALLNSTGGVANTSDGETVDYAYSTPEEVIQMVQDAVASGELEATKDLFAAANEAGCPLSGTRAVKCN